MVKTLVSHVRYNSIRDGDSNDWFFLIINRKDKIGEVKRRVEKLFVPMFDETAQIKGKYEKGKLEYELMRFHSQKNIEDYEIGKIFTRVSRDRELYNRKTNSDALEIYVANLDQ